MFPKTRYGLGLQTIGGWHFHGGEIFGWETVVMANPRLHKVVVVNANACCGNALTVDGLAADTYPADLKTNGEIVKALAALFSRGASRARAARAARGGLRISPWSQPGSNRRPPACKAGALPAELWPLGAWSLGPAAAQ